MTERSFQDKLHDVYGAKQKTPDIFGKRPATPREIREAIQTITDDKFESSISRFSPTAEDIQNKGDD